MRFLPIVLGWVIAASALSAIASIPGPSVHGANDLSDLPAAHSAG
ncbi:hypothetical protein [Thalassovita mediterranea]|nr:hypothetical protein [Thalassovita mediterranea]